MRYLFTGLAIGWFIVVMAMFYKGIWIDTKPECDHYINTGFLFLFLGIWAPMGAFAFWSIHEMKKGDD